MKNFIKVGVGVAALALSSLASAEIVNLNDWTQFGSAGSGNWIVSQDGYSVVQTVNSQPTYFVSGESYLDVEFNGRIAVETTSDDDWIGFVLGFNGLDDYYLFDWKQGDQSGALEGFSLSKVSGTDVDFWNHTGSDIEVIASNYGLDLGWEDNTVYHYNVGYTLDNISISINGGGLEHQEIFNISNLSNVAGSFGFYNYSQSDVRYIGSGGEACTTMCGSAENLAVHTVPLPASVGLLGLVMAGFTMRKKQTTRN